MSDDALSDDDMRGLADALLAMIRAMQAEADEATVAEMERRLEDDALAHVTDDQVVLFGLEGQVDRVWLVPEPRPDILRVPIAEGRRSWLNAKDVPPRPTLRTADYRRITRSTYQRIPRGA